MVNMSGNLLQPAPQTPNDVDDFEEVGNSAAVELDMKQEADFQKIMEGVEDMGKDSYYPLVTNDESKKVDYVIKINQDKLDKVFDP